MADEALEYNLNSRDEVLDEDRLLVCAARNETDAAGRLYDKYYNEVFGYIYHGTFDRAVAEDLTSNVFLAAFRHLGRFQWRQIPFRAWLYRIATNEMRMHYRRARRARVRHFEPGEGTDAAAPASDPSVAAEEYRLLHEALLQLKPKYHTAIVLRYFEGKTIAEIADITGRRPGTIKSQLHRGLAQLQDVLLRHGVWPQ
jgi:RNA polymerase sigma-70 factor (ECF subfamily)